MSTLPPPPQPLPKVAFTGGIRQGPLGWGGTAPFGHLEFDDNELRIWGLGMELSVTRSEVKAVQLSTGILASRVSVIWPDGSKANIYFAALGRGAVREALRQRGWPVIEGRSPTA